MPQIHLPQPKSWLSVNGEAQYPITVGYFSLPWVCTQVRSVKNQRRLKFPDYFRRGGGWVPRVTQPKSMGELMPCVVNFDQSETGTSRQNPLHSFPIWSFPHMVRSQSLSGSYLIWPQTSCAFFIKLWPAFPLTLALRLHLPIKALLVAVWALHSSFLGNHV